MLDDITIRSVSEKLDAFCDRRVPPRIRDKLQLEYEFRGRSITLSEHRPSFRDAENWTVSPVAQFRLAPVSNFLGNGQAATGPTKITTGSCATNRRIGRS